MVSISETAIPLDSRGGKHRVSYNSPYNRCQSLTKEGKYSNRDSRQELSRVQSSVRFCEFHSQSAVDGSRNR